MDAVTQKAIEGHVEIIRDVLGCFTSANAHSSNISPLDICTFFEVELRKLRSWLEHAQKQQDQEALR